MFLVTQKVHLELNCGSSESRVVQVWLGLGKWFLLVSIFSSNYLSANRQRSPPPRRSVRIVSWAVQCPTFLLLKYLAWRLLFFWQIWRFSHSIKSQYVKKLPTVWMFVLSAPFVSVSTAEMSPVNKQRMQWGRRMARWPPRMSSKTCAWQDIAAVCHSLHDERLDQQLWM
jgi:hypothetical protein